jgi:hypothetical protein
MPCPNFFLFLIFKYYILFSFYKKKPLTLYITQKRKKQTPHHLIHFVREQNLVMKMNIIKKMGFCNNLILRNHYIIIFKKKTMNYQKKNEFSPSLCKISLSYQGRNRTQWRHTLFI